MQKNVIFYVKKVQQVPSVIANAPLANNRPQDLDPTIVFSTMGVSHFGPIAYNT